MGAEAVPRKAKSRQVSVELTRVRKTRERIDELENELNRILGAVGNTLAPAFEGKKRGRMSAAGRAAIAAGARARWAKVNGTNDSSKPAKRRKMSAAARARIAASARERWKRAKAAGRNAL